MTKSKKKKGVSSTTHGAALGKIAKLQALNKELRAGNRKLKKTLKRVEQSRAEWRKKAIARRITYADLKKWLLKQSRKGKPKGHLYPTWLITLVISLRIYCNCSYGSIKKVVEILQINVLGIEQDEVKIPCKKTLQNWVSKVGYYHLKKIDKDLIDKEVCLFIDESIRVGPEKLFVVLVCSAEKLEKGALSYQDVSVIYLNGSDSWKSEKIVSELKPVLLERGLIVKYIVSDEAANLKKGYNY